MGLVQHNLKACPTHVPPHVPPWEKGMSRCPAHVPLHVPPKANEINDLQRGGT